MTSLPTVIELSLFDALLSVEPLLVAFGFAYVIFMYLPAVTFCGSVSVAFTLPLPPDPKKR